jgi:hypothetical protein
MLDINKDNDALPDVTDKFPLMGEFAFDSDNDDIGDEGDFIRAQGPCTRSSRYALRSLVAHRGDEASDSNEIIGSHLVPAGLSWATVF